MLVSTNQSFIEVEHFIFRLPSYFSPIIRSYHKPYKFKLLNIQRQLRRPVSTAVGPRCASSVASNARMQVMAVTRSRETALPSIEHYLRTLTSFCVSSNSSNWRSKLPLDVGGLMSDPSRKALSGCMPLRLANVPAAFCGLVKAEDAAV
jgi:hypothetical protein